MRIVHLIIASVWLLCVGTFLKQYTNLYVYEYNVTYLSSIIISQVSFAFVCSVMSRLRRARVPCLVYLLLCHDGYKIGITSIHTIGARLRQLRCGNPTIIKPLGLWRFKNRFLAGAVERALHETYKDKKFGCGGQEWFQLGSDASKAFSAIDKFCTQYGGALRSLSDCLIIDKQ